MYNSLIIREYKEGTTMKNLKKLIVAMLVMSITMATMIFTVSADTTTDLSDLKVYAVDASGNKTPVKMDFKSTTYDYNITVKSTTVSISIEPTTADSTSTAVVEKDGINTVMTTGANYTSVLVTSATGLTQRYVLNTTKVTADKDSTVEVGASDDDIEKTEKKKTDKEVKVGKETFKISNSFKKSDIPEGFSKTTAKYDGESYTCIKGDVKELTAFYLYNDDSEGFYIYDEDEDTFYAMNNIKIKSRMYTVVNPSSTETVLKNYSTKTIEVIDTKVKVWVLNEEEGMYLLYAMNWNGETSLYCYDDNEKCFQRYIVDNDVNSKMDAANKAYKNLQKKYNNLVDKYNLLLKILCGLVVVIIILLFIIFNLALNRKAKKIKAEQLKKSVGNDTDGTDDIDEGSNDDDIVSANDFESVERDNADADDIDAEVEESIEEDIEDALAESVASIINEEALNEEKPEPVVDLSAELDSKEKEQEEAEEPQEAQIPKRKLFGKNNIDRPYGDEPTFGLSSESNEGFYGGEIEEEDEILIDISDDEPNESGEVVNETVPVQQDDDDDDFEFIDLD